MKKNRNLDELISGIVLLAKQSGLTSFSSLFSIKHALDTSKVGHTGTLDSFADGLLVVLTGRLTRLVPHITDFNKTYLALVEFGSETDTLDPVGNVVKTGFIPSKEDVLKVLSQFRGEIQQVPPMFSALHVDGKRLSDLAREGKTVEIKSRKITIHSLELLDFYEKYALLEVKCSKGTYIRCLARDIAEAMGTCAHLFALRRTAVGPYRLEDAVNYEKLEDFSIKSLLKRGKISDSLSLQKAEKNLDEENETQDKIRKNLKKFDFAAAKECGMESVILNSYSLENYRNGRPVKSSSFYFEKKLPERCELAVFYPDLQFGGCMVKNKNRFEYGFMIPPKNTGVKIFTWEQIVKGKFDSEFRETGIAGTIGSFDGSHLGHQKLFDAVLSQKNLVPGVITFTKSLRCFKDGNEYPGDVASLAQKLESLAVKGFKYVILIDFSAEFGKLKGRDFLNILVKQCGLSYLAEGKDFRCGYKGQVDMNMMAELGIALKFNLDTIDSVMYEGEKVSSSRIRRCINEKKMKAVSEMLLHSFSIDCSGFEWIQKTESEKKVWFAKCTGNQLLPPDGTYSVAAEVVLNSSKSGEAKVLACTADCTLEDGALHLTFSDNLISGFVRSVKFG